MKTVRVPTVTLTDGKTDNDQYFPTFSCSSSNVATLTKGSLQISDGGLTISGKVGIGLDRLASALSPQLCLTSGNSSKGVYFYYDAATEILRITNIAPEEIADREKEAMKNLGTEEAEKARKALYAFYIDFAKNNGTILKQVFK